MATAEPMMPTSLTPSRRASQPEPETTSFGAWTLVWCLYLTKLITIIIIVWIHHSSDAAVFIAITTWFWLGPLLAFGAAPLLFRLRLLRARTRRASLLRAEWEQANERPASGPASAGLRPPA